MVTQSSPAALATPEVKLRKAMRAVAERRYPGNDNIMAYHEYSKSRHNF
jgi:hypothetical protein